PLLLELGDRHEPQCGGVHAVPLPSAIGRTVAEQVSQVTVGTGGAHLCPDHPVGPVGHRSDRVLADRLGEARPSRAAVVLVGRGEQGLAGDYVDVDAWFVVVPVLVAERWFGAALLRDAYLCLCEPA